MRKWLKHTKNEKGLTLVELLAVVVILGIIAAIAVPSIGGIIDNSKKDAHVANAQQMVSSARLAVTGESNLRNMIDGTQYIPLGYLIKEGYLEAVSDPDGTDYIIGEDELETTNVIANAGDNYVTVVKSGNTFSYSVKLGNATRGIQTESGAAVSEAALDRDKVIANP
ncbi:type II secretion system protein [Alkalihalophilus sp. As8PL]|uniref:Type II secretion system protein n=1 Tax=Alkalihalophilus sp. As8PL TaxID=3237103 RepID=A0AB39BQG0_9BACI